MAKKPLPEEQLAPITIASSRATEFAPKLEAAMDGTDAEINSTRVSNPELDLPKILERLGKSNSGRVLILDRVDLPDDPAEVVEQILCEEDAPALIVLSSRNDATDRAGLLAAGVSFVLDPAVSEEHLQVAVQTIAQAEAQDVCLGPEIRGNQAQPTLADFLSRSPSMQRFVTSARKVAPVDCSLLITGETGVGKERLARAIHEASGSQGAFVAVNCGALPEALLESQLFGHEAGAFTGAKSKHKGFFEQAHGGVLFLDEVGEIPQHLQVKLLTALQRHEVQPLGAEKPIVVNTRVMAATNRDPKQEVADGKLREDLYFRLNVINLRIPPLRKRKEDIPDLVGELMQFFRCQLSHSSIETISEEALDVLVEYAWPGNVREMINVIERCMVLGEGTQLTVNDLPHEVRSGGAQIQTRDEDVELLEPSELTFDLEEMSLKDAREQAVARTEKAYLRQALERYQGRIKDVAGAAGIGTRSLYDKMQRYGLRKEEFKD